MKTLVVYYSRQGHTETVAKSIAQALRADTEKLIDTTDRSDIVGWHASAYHPEVQLPAKLEKPQKNPKDYDLVVIGTPIWDNATPGTPAVMAYASMMQFPKHVAFFATCGASEFRAFDHLAKLTKRTPIATLEIQDRDVQLKRYPEMVDSFVKTLKAK